MTNLLITLFIGHGSPSEESTRTKYSNLASVVGAITNTLLFLVKLIIGLLLNSISIIADAVNNITDSLANLLVIVGIKLAGKPADYKHPFGHARIEYITSLIIAALMLFLGYEFMRSSISHILNPEEIGFDIVLVSILAASGLLKLWQSGFYKKLGKTIASEPLIALSKDSRNDVIIAIALVSSVIFTHITGIIIDGYIGAFVSLIILYSGFSVARDTASKLIGEAVDYESAAQIVDIVESHDKVLSAHDLVVHNYGPTRSMTTVHVDMCDKLSFKEAHAITDKIALDVKEKLGLELLIHIDPVSLDDHRLNELRKSVESYLDAIDKRLNAFDFSIIDNENCVDVLLKVEMPGDYDDSQLDEIFDGLSKKITALDEKYNPIIGKDPSFVMKKKDETE